MRSSAMRTGQGRNAGREKVGRARPQDIDRYVGARMRERRIMLGLTQQQLADLIGVTYQQAHKYEKGINRVAAGRLYHIARALGVEVSYFFEGLQTADRLVPSPKQRMLLDLARNYLNIPVPEHQAAVVALARALAEVRTGTTWPREVPGGAVRRLAYTRRGEKGAGAVRGMARQYPRALWRTPFLRRLTPGALTEGRPDPQLDEAGHGLVTTLASL